MELVRNHVNIVSLEAVYEDKKHIYLVQELCGGGELFDKVVEEGELSELVARDLFRDAAIGVEYLHSQRICHLDVKPENLLIGENNTVKLADFGLAMVLGRGDELEYSVGTPAYWAPEMVNKRPYSFPVDVWALGCVLYILLCGVHPFDPYGDDEEGVILERVKTVDYETDTFSL